MTVFDAIMLMLTFSLLIVAILTFVLMLVEYLTRK